MEEKQRELRGLTSQEVQERKEKGLINTASTVKTKSVKRIFYDNICTVFNIINVILFIALLCVGSYKNLLFMLVIAAGFITPFRLKKPGLPGIFVMTLCGIATLLLMIFGVKA